MKDNFKFDIDWKQKMRKQIAEGKTIDEFVPKAAAANWLVYSMLQAGLVPHIDNLGAGVKRITTKEHLCGTCKGLGLIK